MPFLVFGSIWEYLGVFFGIMAYEHPGRVGSYGGGFEAGEGVFWRGRRSFKGDEEGGFRIKCWFTLPQSPETGLSETGEDKGVGMIFCLPWSMQRAVGPGVLLTDIPGGIEHKDIEGFLNTKIRKPLVEDPDIGRLLFSKIVTTGFEGVVAKDAVYACEGCDGIGFPKTIF